MRAALGHDGPPQMYWRAHLLTGEPLRRCPMRDVLETAPEVRQEVEQYHDWYFPRYEAGHLAIRGGVDDQPALWWDYMARFALDAQRMQAKYQALDAEG